jgi:hypothetical protein
MKKQFGKKDMQSFYKVILLAHCISFSPFYKKMVNNVVMTSAFINNMDEPFCVGCPHGKNHWQVFPKHVQHDKAKKTDKFTM